jgi:ribosomal protein S18 acetylase RimI-like enzyme
MSSFVSMRPGYYPVFFELASEAYASENVLAGRWPADDALDAARSETERLLPQGLATPENQLLEILESDEGPTVGFVWFARMKRGSSYAAFIYQIYVIPEARRRGYAKAALEAIEKLATEQGLSSVALHVFAHNEGAQALYKSIGYSVASLNMHKLLSPGDA